MNEPVLELRGIEKGYKLGKPGEVRVLRGADLTIGRGEVVALVAPSGAGKSTLLHIAGLLDTPNSGEVRIGGEEMSGRSDRRRTAVRRSEVGFIYQFHHLLPEFSAAENVILPQLANGAGQAAAAARAADLLAASASPTAPITAPRPFRAASNSAWPFAGRWPTSRASSSPTSPQATSIPRPRSAFSLR